MLTHTARRGTFPAWGRDVAAVLLLAILTLFFFWRLLTPDAEDRLAMPRGDFTDQYYPLRHFVAENLSQGQLPFWNPHIYGGQPGIADPQAATFYPPALLNALFWGADYSLLALELEVIAHLGWAMLGAYAFMRRGIGLAVLPALFGSLVWGFGGYLTGFPLQQVTILETVAWLPWLLWAVRGTVQASFGQRRISAALGAVAVGCAVLAGHPQSLLYLLYLATAYALFLLWQSEGWSWRGWLTRGSLVLLMLGLGVGVAAIQLYPTLAFIGDSTRDTLTYDFVRGGQAWAELIEIWLPKIVGSTPLYGGIITLLLVGVAVVTPPQQAEKRFWIAVGLLSLVLAVGSNSAIYDLFYLGAPGFSSIRSQERVLIWRIWAISLLAAWGIAALTPRTDDTPTTSPQRYLALIGKTLPLFVLPLLVLWWFRALEFSQFSVNLEVLVSFFDRYTFFVVMLIGSWGLLAWLSRRAAPPLWAGALVVAVLLFDLFSITRTPHLGDRYVTSLPRNNEVVEALQNEPNVGRIGIVGSPIPSGNDGMLWDFELLTGNEPLRLDLTNQIFSNTPPLRQFQLMNVTHVVADINLAEAEPDLYEHIAASSEGAASHLHRLRPTFPYAWWVLKVTEVDGRNTLYRELRADDFDPFNRALIDRELTPLAPDSATAASQATVTVIRTTDDFTELQTTHAAEGALLLVVAEPSVSGWEIAIDGQPVRRERINALNIGIAVPSGTHTVTLTYRQPQWERGLWVSGIALVGIILLGALPIPTRPRPALSQPTTPPKRKPKAKRDAK